MFDIEALEAAGFTKVLTEEQWAASVGTPLVNYRLVRGNVSLNTERNTQEQANGGLQTTVRYPEIVVLQNLVHLHRVSCDASDTDLILLLAEEMERSTHEMNNRRPQRGTTNG